MKISDIVTEHVLTERVVNLFKPTDKEKYASEVWDMLIKAYEPVGGFGTAANVEELVNTPGMWKLVVRDGAVSALTIYKDQHGRKAIASATNATRAGSKDYRMIRQDDTTLTRSWAEVSGKPEELFKKIGAAPIPHKFANILTGKHILKYNDDGYHYTRLIAGTPREKIIYGTVELSPELIQTIQDAGIDLKELPSKVKSG